MNTESEIENKVKQTSIRGRFAFGVFCIEKYLSENNVKSKWFDKLIPILWEFTNTDRMDLWEEKISDLTPLNILDSSPRNSYSDYPSLTELELDRHYAINLKATTLLTIEFIRQFKFNKNGRVINLSSGQSLGQMPNEIAYAITKGAIETLTYIFRLI